MNEGTFIKTYPLTSYPTESQELMQKIVHDFKYCKIEVLTHKGSYSIKRIHDTETAVKIICTIGSRFETSGTGVMVLYRKELVKKIGIDDIRSANQDLDLSKNLVTVGGGTYRDFYYIRIDTIEIYLSKKEGILALAEKIVSSIGLL